MKKLLMLLVVIAMAAPAMATSIEFIATDNEDGTATVSYVVTDGTLRGMALNVDADAALTDVAVDSFFDVFMDAAFGDPENYALGDGTPIASQDVAGEIALPSASFCISMGNLEGAQDVDEIVLTCDVDAAGTIDINTLRGGIVDTDGAAVTVTNAVWPLPFTITVGGGDCMDSGAPEYATWVAAGKPDSWCTDCQPKGNANGDNFVDGLDVQLLIPSFNKPLGDSAYNADADFNHDGFVDGLDVQILIPSFNKSCDIL